MNWRLVFSFVFIFLFLVTTVSAVDNPLEQQAEDLQDKVDNLGNIADSDEKDQIAKNYLKEQWGHLLSSEDYLNRHPYFKPVAALYHGYKAISPYTDPVLGWLVGMTPSLSLLFVLVLVIWYVLVNSSFAAYESLRDHQFFSKRGTTLIYLAFLAILFLLKIFQMLSVWLGGLIVSALVKFFTTWWMQVLGIFIVFGGFGVVQVLQKKLRVYLAVLRAAKDVDKNHEVAEEGDRQVKRIKKIADKFVDANK